MTAAQIRAAAEIVENAALMDTEIVTFMELGSEGCLFRINARNEQGERQPRILIARDGTWSGEA